MPLPIIHTCAGICAYEASKKREKQSWKRLLLFIAISNVPDLDFVPGLLMGYAVQFHRLATHSFFVAFLFACVAGFIAKKLKLSFRHYFLTSFILYSIHLILDYINGPKGLLLFWPFTDAFYGTAVSLLPTGGSFESVGGIGDMILALLSSSSIARMYQELIVGVGAILVIRAIMRLKAPDYSRYFGWVRWTLWLFVVTSILCVGMLAVWEIV